MFHGLAAINGALLFLLRFLVRGLGQFSLRCILRCQNVLELRKKEGRKGALCQVIVSLWLCNSPRCVGIEIPGLESINHICSSRHIQVSRM